MPKYTAHRTSRLGLGHYAALGLAVASCGHRATAEDCEHIVVRITELELQEARVSDPGNVSTQIAQTKETFSASALSDCVGRRIAADTLACVDRASTARQIVDECFD